LIKLKRSLNGDNRDYDKLIKDLVDSKVGPKGDSIIGPKPVAGKDYKIPKDGKTIRGPRGYKGDSIKGDPGKDSDEELIIKEVLKNIPKPKDGKTIKGPRGYKGLKGNSVDEKKVIEKLEETVDKKFTKKEEEFLKKLSESFHPKLIEMVQRLQVHGGGLSREEILALIAGAGGGGKMGRTDLSPQCDSSNLVFTFDEAFTSGTEIIRYSSFPFIYRPGVDYVVTNATQITFQIAEVVAPKTGQTLMSSYEKA